MVSIKIASPKMLKGAMIGLIVFLVILSTYLGFMLFKTRYYLKAEVLVIRLDKIVAQRSETNWQNNTYYLASAELMYNDQIYRVQRKLKTNWFTKVGNSMTIYHNPENPSQIRDMYTIYSILHIMLIVVIISAIMFFIYVKAGFKQK